MGFPEVDSFWLRTTHGLLDFKRFYPNNGTLHQLKSKIHLIQAICMFSSLCIHSTSLMFYKRIAYDSQSIFLIPISLLSFPEFQLPPEHICSRVLQQLRPAYLELSPS